MHSPLVVKIIKMIILAMLLLAKEFEMLFAKITEGCVVQLFNDQGQCVKQDFHAGDVCTYYEQDTMCEINIEQMPFKGNEYFPFDMVQPKEKQ